MGRVLKFLLAESSSIGRRQRRNNAGVSLVIETVLMSLIVVAASVALLTYGMSYLGQTGSYFDVMTGAYEQKSQERFTVDDVWFNSSNQVHVSIYNFGKVPVSVYEVSFNETIFGDVDIQVDPGQRIRLNFDLPWTSGIYQVRVLTDGGNVYEGYWRA